MGVISTTLNKVFNIFNLEIEIKRRWKFDTERVGYSYARVLPNASFAPWVSDSKFNSIYSRIKPYTLVDVYRCYEIWQLIKECIKTNPTGAYLEVGVWRGGTGAIIAERLKEAKLNVPLYLADTFAGVAKASHHDSAFTGGEYSNTSKELVEKMIHETVGYQHATCLQGIFPEETAHLIHDNIQFQFCHVDVDVYLSAKGVVDWIWNRMPSGGIILYDDYGFFGCDGITKFVEEERLKKDRLVIHNLNGHAIVIKLK